MIELFARPILIFVLLMQCLLVACGKKTQTEQSPVETTRQNQTEIDSFLSKQVVSCDENQACPSYVAKIVVIQGSKHKFCTGVLIDESTIATSASCLPSLLRLNGQDCSLDLFFFFPKTSNREAERVGCSRVVQVSDLEGTNPNYWRDDVAFLKLQRSLPTRRQATISREGVGNNKAFTTWMVEQLGDNYTGIIRQSVCTSVHNSYVNPLSSNLSSPNLIFADCLVPNGGTGAPLIDNRGKMRALVSDALDKNIRSSIESSGLLFSALSPILHASNFACAATPQDDTVLDEKECAKDLTVAKLEELLENMFKPENIFNAEVFFPGVKKKLEASLSAANSFLKFGVNPILNKDGAVTGVETYPKCFKPIKSWINDVNRGNTQTHSFVHPQTLFRPAIDSNGIALGVMANGPNEKKYLQFSLKGIKFSSSYVFLWTENETQIRKFYEITQVCPGEKLLF